MLQIAPDAVDSLRDFGAIRITAADVDGDLEISIENATDPQEGDVVVERDGARVFLDAAASEALGNQVFGVHAHGDHLHFTFDDQQ